MTNRRQLLTPAAAGQAPAQAASCECARPQRGPYADYFPNLVVVTHEGRRALFYDDLLRGKTVLLNCMSLKQEAVYPMTPRLLEVQRLLGERLGHEVFIYSLTLDPEHDTPRVLRAFAEKAGVGPGWLFLTGKPENVHALHGRLFFQAAGQAAGQAGGHAEHAAPAHDCSAGVIRYGNEAVGLWGTVPVKTAAEGIVQRLAWIAARPQPVGPPQRRGPVIPPSKT